MSNELIPSQDEVRSIEVMAKHAVDSKYVEKLGGYAGVFSIAMYARELGIPVMTALFGGMANIMGKIQISPQLMNAMIRKAGHKLEIDSTDARCIIKGTRKDTGESCSTSFSVEEAKKAGIYKSGGGWEKYPSDMCFARALSRLARRLFPDVIGMAYVEGEIEEDRPHKQPRNEDTVDIQKEEEITDKEYALMFEETFKSIENLDYDFHDFFSSMSKKNGKSFPEIIKQAVKHGERFSKSYLAWVEEQKAVVKHAQPVESLLDGLSVVTLDETK